MVQGALQQVVDPRLRMLRLDSGANQLAAVGGEQCAGVIAPQLLAPIVNDHFTQRVKFTLAGLLKDDFATEEKIEFAGELAFWPAGALGHGFDEAVILRKPMHDEARVSKSRLADDDGVGAVHETLEGCARARPMRKVKGFHLRKISGTSNQTSVVMIMMAARLIQKPALAMSGMVS